MARTTRRTPVWLTTADVAAECGITTRTVERWAANGRLPAYRIGGGRVVRFKADDVDKLVQRIPSAASR